MFIRLLTFGVFVLLGFDLSKNIPRPKSVRGWTANIATVLVIGLSSVKIPAVVIFGFELFPDMIILGTCFGFITGFIIRLLPAMRS